uniref:Uncharacterized protein n=1 Tax=Anguilla anguilla TaxID=7936 RepID=A0A0E9XNC6_ANGAN
MTESVGSGRVVTTLDLRL